MRFGADGVIWPWTIDLETGTVTEHQIDDSGVEFPRIDDRLAGLPARYVVSVGTNQSGALRPNSGRADQHGFGTAAPGEAVFVPSTSGRRRGQGLVSGIRLRPGT